MNLQEKQLGQLRPVNTTAASLYSPAANLTGIAKNLVVSNTTAILATFRVFVDDDGTTFDETTALFFDTPLKGNTTVLIDMYAAMNDPAGNFAVRTDTASALTFTLFGAELT
jgi:hypothetical protein